jgi:hypothetical protein
MADTANHDQLDCENHAPAMDILCFQNIGTPKKKRWY